jgi:hypothetical protein
MRQRGCMLTHIELQQLLLLQVLLLQLLQTGAMLHQRW